MKTLKAPTNDWIKHMINENGITLNRQFGLWQPSKRNVIKYSRYVTMSSRRTLIPIEYQEHANGLYRIYVISVGGIVAAMISSGYQLTLAVGNLCLLSYLLIMIFKHAVQQYQFVTFFSRITRSKMILLQRFVQYCTSSLVNNPVSYNMRCHLGREMGRNFDKRLVSFGGFSWQRRQILHLQRLFVCLMRLMNVTQWTRTDSFNGSRISITRPGHQRRRTG